MWLKKITHFLSSHMKLNVDYTYMIVIWFKFGQDKMYDFMVQI